MQYIALHKAAKGIEYCCAPIWASSPQAIAIQGVKDSRIPLRAGHSPCIFECVAMCFNWVFSIDAGNVSHRESLYLFTSLPLSAIYIFAPYTRSGKEYSVHMDGVLVQTVICLPWVSSS